MLKIDLAGGYTRTFKVQVVIAATHPPRIEIVYVSVLLLSNIWKCLLLPSGEFTKGVSFI